MHHSLSTIASWLIIAACTAVTHAAEAPFDLVIENGRIIDGTGSPWYYGDLGIRDGRIVRIGRLHKAETRRRIDARDRIVAPGFVDMMGQTATPMLDNPASALNLLTQGITTINAGEGVSAAPLSATDSERTGWQTLGEYFQLLEQKGLPLNVAQTVGHTQVRRLVLGDVDRRPTDAELDEMRALVRQAMEDGAIGLSTALIYPPAVYASKEEIAALAAVAGEYGGRYFTHMRNEGDRLLEAIDEALEIGQIAGTPVHIFHLKAAGRANWPQMDQAIARIRAARGRGQQVAADIYPYINNGLGIEAFIHPRHFGEGRDKLIRQLDDLELQRTIRHEMETLPGWENWFRHIGQDWDNVVLGNITAAEYRKYAGQSLGAIARATQMDPWDLFFSITRQGGAFALPQSMTEANKNKLMQQEFISFCTDVGPAGGSRIASHPRGYGSFPRILGRYVRDLGVISFERAIAQGSALACNEIMAFDRGRISEGQAADLIIFDPLTIGDRATFSEPHELSVGMDYVVVNGQIVLEDGKLTEARPGRILRGPGYDPGRQPAAIRTSEHFEQQNAVDAMAARFVNDYQVPGLALAVTHQGRLVHSAGYGYADLGQRTPATSQTLFRIASLSKPLTAVGILQLVEQNRLQLDDRVFDILSGMVPANGFEGRDPRLKQITIRHLLQHTGGWDRNASFDAMFQSVRFARLVKVDPPADQSTVIQAMFDQPLDFDPGQKYAYSNFGYCLLGRVIEKVSGQSYGDYMQQHVFGPLGMSRMHLGHTRLAQRLDGEARYYDPHRGDSVFAADLSQQVASTYGTWNLEAMDAHGGWLASVEDLARFVSAFDDPDNCPVLSSESIRIMFARPDGPPGETDDGPVNPYYACGWLIRTRDDGSCNAWHTGSLPGTAALMVKRHDGFCWVALMNARKTPSVSHLARALDPLVHPAVDAVENWPEGLPLRNAP